MAQPVKNSPCNTGDLGSIPGLGRCPGGGSSYPLQYSGLENATDGIVHGVVESDTTETFASFEYGTHRNILYANRFLTEWCRKSHLPNKMRSDAGLKINASV